MAYQLTTDDKRQAQQMAQQMFTQRQPTQTQDRGNLLTKSLSTIGGIGGGILGSIVAPGVGTAAGGALGAGGGKWLQNLLEGNKDLGQGVLGEAALGTVGGIGKGFSAIKGATGALKAGQGLGTAANILKMGVPKATTAMAGQGASKLLTSAGKTLEKAGGKTLGTQSLMTAAQARSKGINPMQAFTNVNKRTGLTSLDDMAEVSRGLTGGKDSMLDMLTREAVGSTNGVKIPSLKNVAEMAMDSKGSLLTPNQRKAVLYNANKAGTTMYGGGKGTLSTLANPQIALDQANMFRQNAKQLTSGFTASAQDKQLSKVYNTLADSIETSLYSSPGVSESIPSLVKAGSDDLMFKAQDLRKMGNTAQAKAYEKVAVDLRKVSNVKELRTFKKDFVDMGMIDSATAQAEGARGLGTGALAGALKPIAIASNLATPKVGGGLIKAGQALQGGLPNIPSLGMSGAQKIAGSQLGARALTGNLPGASSTQPDMSPMGGSPMGQMSGASILGGMGSMPETGSAQSGQIYTKDAVAKDIQADLAATGGANMDKYITLFNFLNPETKTTTSSSYSRPSAQQYSMATGGMTGVDQMSQMLSQNPGLLTKTAIPGQELPIIGGLISNLSGTGTYNAQAQNVLDSLARARTGAAMPASEKAFYERLLPRAGDSEETVQNKLALLRQSFEPFMGYGASADTAGF
jgi:hypothetical protein